MFKKAGDIMREADPKSPLGKVFAAMSASNAKLIDVGKFRIIIQESSENPPLGIIIDVLNPKTADVVHTFTAWYDDMEKG